MIHNPCKKDCPKRSATCHGICKDYKEFRAEMDKYLETKARHAEVDEVIIGSIERAKKRSKK